jgi:hypothetical protein
MSLRSALLAVVPLAVLSAALGACSVKAFSSDNAATPTVNNTADFDAGSGDGGANPTGSGEAGPDVAIAPGVPGSPLCGAALPGACYPDDPVTAKQCGIAPDGGPYSGQAGYGDTILACRVQASADSPTGVEPACAPAGSAGDGSWCKSSAECAPTYDCVGAGTCQRYCCRGNVECLADQFCDIQATASASSVRVPVCMPVHPSTGCQLLDPGACPATETCAVVRENGATSCVAVGAAKANDGCEKDHCAAGLVCLGQPGQRLCYQLCHTTTATSVNECSSTQQCKGGLPLFPDPSVGICE